MFVFVGIPVFPSACPGQRGFAAFGGFIFVDGWQFEGELAFVERLGDITGVVDGYRFAPVALPAEYGVAHSVIHFGTPYSPVFRPADGGLNGFGAFHAVNEPGVDHAAVFFHRRVVQFFGAFDHAADGQSVIAGEPEIPVVGGGHGHDHAGAVSGEDVIRYPELYLFPVEGIDHIRTRKYAGYRLDLRHALSLGPVYSLGNVGFHLIALTSRGERGHQLVLRCQHHVRHPENGVRARGETGQGDVPAVYIEIEFAAVGFADPVGLHLFHGCRPLETFEVFEKPVGISGDAHHPLPHLFALHGVTAALRESVFHLVIGQHGAQGRTPVDDGFGGVGEPVLQQQTRFFGFTGGIPFRCGEQGGIFIAGGIHVFIALGAEAREERLDDFGTTGPVVEPAFEELQENPLGPPVIPRVAGLHLARPVVRQPQVLELSFVSPDVFGGGEGGMLAGLDGVLLCRQAEGVETHGMQHIESLQLFVAAHDVGGDVAERMPDVETCPRRVREHIQRVKFWLVRTVFHPVYLLFFPVFLPFPLDVAVMIIGHEYFAFGLQN